jgi:hypothetical protein
LAKRGIETMVANLRRSIEARMGDEVAASVVDGFGRASKGGRGAVALWTKGAMERLDSIAGQEARFSVMEECGHRCAMVNHAPIDGMIARRRRSADEEAFIQAELRSPMKGVRLEREGQVIRQYYTPRAFGRGMRCYCSLANGLPEDQVMSSTYCHCSLAFVREMWQEALGRPVRVELLKTALTGSNECEFAMRI